MRYTVDGLDHLQTLTRLELLDSRSASHAANLFSVSQRWPCPLLTISGNCCPSARKGACQYLYCKPVLRRWPGLLLTEGARQNTVSPTNSVSVLPPTQT